MILRRFYDEQLAQASFLVGCGASGEAVIVDPNRDVDQYVDAAEEEGLRIVAVTETHIHADFVSGARELADRTGATLFLSAEGGSDWQYEYASHFGTSPLRDGDEIKLGNVVLRAMHTPGHTPEHVSFVLIDRSVSEQPMGVFTGDFVFSGDVGRPDLLETAAGVQNTMRSSAETLYRSLQRFRELPPQTILWPGHGSGSPCGKSLGGTPETTLGYELASNWAFRAGSLEAFSAEVLRDQPEPPRYFADMKRLNKHGSSRTVGLGHPPRLAVSRLAEILGSDAVVLDLRQRPALELEHIDRTVGIPFASRSFLMYAGSLLTPENTVYLLAADAAQARSAALGLSKIGIDQVCGWFQDDAALSAARTAGRVRPLPRISPHEFLRAAEEGTVQAVDLRSQAERGAAVLPAVSHLPLARLHVRRGELSNDRPVALHCQSGIRAIVATTYLLRYGYEAEAVREGFATLEKIARTLEPLSAN